MIRCILATSAVAAVAGSIVLLGGKGPAKKRYTLLLMCATLMYFVWVPAGPADLAVLIWLCGAAAFVLTELVRRLAAARGAEPFAGPEDSLEAGRRFVNVPGFSVYTSKRVRAPMLCGKKLLLPRQSYAPGELGAIFLHFLIHQKRNDGLAALFVFGAAALHWFNPFSYILLSRSRALREQAVDDVMRCICEDGALEKHTLLFEQRRKGIPFTFLD